MPHVVKFKDWKMVGTNGTRHPAFNCPKCGNAIILDSDFKVSAEGWIRPCIVCMHGKCEFEEHVRLEGYQP